MLSVGVVGGTGYTGSELLRLLCVHPEVRVVLATSRKEKGRPVADLLPHLRGLVSLEYSEFDARAAADACDLLFLALPHGTAADHVKHLWEHDVKIVDLSADYRLPPDIYAKVYGHANPFPQQATYGLPELRPEVARARLVANPGCYPTGASLAAAPLVAAGLVELAVFDSKSGISGAGTEPTATSHYPNMAENVIPYSVTTHRHRAEIVQELGRLGDVRVRFVPHVFPGVRGILTTAHLELRRDVTPDEVERLYRDFYARAPFVRLQKPHLANVRGTNFCDIAWEVNRASPREVVVLSAIDNLGKGAAGQAVQNMNLMCGLDQTRGLFWPGLAP